MKQTVIGDLVLQDVKDRIELGKKRYGRPLTTNNGRDGLQDLKEELLDAVFYITQVIEERKEQDERS